MKIVAALVVLLAAAQAAQAATTQVTVSVPVAQALEGPTAVRITPSAAPIRGQIVVKSNVPWTLVARTAGALPGSALRVAGGAWTPLGGETVVLQGGRGVYVVTYEVRAQAAGTVTLSLAPAAAAP